VPHSVVSKYVQNEQKKCLEN